MLIELNPRRWFARHLSPAPVQSGAQVPTEPLPAGQSLQVVVPAKAEEKSMSFLSVVIQGAEKLFGGFFTKLLSTDEAKSLETAVVSFIKTDVGKMAVDAVQYASTLLGQTNDQQKAAAVAALKADMKTAGKDVETLATSTLNLFIEMAFTYVSGTVAALPAAIK